MITQIDIIRRSHPWVEIFEFVWELDETNADKTFTAIYNNVGDFTGKKIIFNMSWLRYLNSKSIGYIADIFQNIEDGNGQMFLTNLTDEVKDTLELVGITTIITVLDTEQEALAQLGIKAAPTQAPQA